MPEKVYLEGTFEKVSLARCPKWCRDEDHFPDHDAESIEESFCHHGPYFVLKSDHIDVDDGPAVEVAVSIWARSEHLKAQAGPPYVEINLSSGGRGDLWITLTPRQASMVGSALLDLARTAGDGHTPKKRQRK